MDARPRRIRAVLFDAVGTLIRLREPVGETYARVAARHGVSLPASRIEEAFGRVLAAAPPDVHPGVPLSRVAALERAWWRDRVRETFRAADQTVAFRDFDAFFEEVFALYGRATAWTLARGAEQALVALAAAGRRLAVVSNFDQRLRPLLAELGVKDAFETIVLPGDAGAAKPDPAIFSVCLKRLGLAAPQAAYVGDRPEQDLRAAARAGLHPIDAGTLATLSEVPARVAALETGAAPGDAPPRLPETA